MRIIVAPSTLIHLILNSDTPAPVSCRNLLITLVVAVVAIIVAIVFVLVIVINVSVIVLIVLDVPIVPPIVAVVVILLVIFIIGPQDAVAQFIIIVFEVITFK